jgi:hypothetical protein
MAKNAGGADDYYQPIMNRLVKAFNESQSFARVIGFSTNVAKADSSMLAPIFSICTLFYRFLRCQSLWIVSVKSLLLLPTIITHHAIQSR